MDRRLFHQYRSVGLCPLDYDITNVSDWDAPRVHRCCSVTAPIRSSAAPERDSMVNLNVWSGPRCCSTALLYSFASREDTTVYDEPLYACYLQKSGASRPYSAQVRQRYVHRYVFQG